MRRASDRSPYSVPHLQAVRTTHTEPDSRTRGCETHPRTSRISSGKIVYEPATEPGGAHRRWLREVPDYRCCLRGFVCCLRHGQPPTPPLGARDDWRRITDWPDTHHAGKQMLLCGAEWEEEPLATTTKRTTTGKCTGTDVVQHLHQRPAHTRRHSQLHLRRRLVHRVARKRLQQHRSVTHVCPEHYDKLLPTNCVRTLQRHRCMCAFPLRNREATRELNVVWNGIGLSNTTTPVYLGIHLDRTLCYKTHIEKTKMKVNARNNIIRKLANSKLGCKSSTLKPSCLALCYSAAEYACPVR